MNSDSELAANKKREYLIAALTALVLAAGWFVDKYVINEKDLYKSMRVDLPRTVLFALIIAHYRTYVVLGGLFLIAMAVYWRQRWIAQATLFLGLLWVVGSSIPVATYHQELNAKIDAYDFDFVDKYLLTKDECAQGKGDIDASEKFLKTNDNMYHTNLGYAFMRNDRRSPSRFVFYALLGVGVPVSHTNDTNQFRRLSDYKFPVIQSGQYSGELAPWDIYFWWTTNSQNYESFPLMDEWLKRDFAQKTVIPMYEKMKASPETAIPNSK